MHFISLIVLAMLSFFSSEQVLAAERLYIYTENFPPYNMSTQRPRVRA